MLSRRALLASLGSVPLISAAAPACAPCVEILGADVTEAGVTIGRAVDLSPDLLRAVALGDLRSVTYAELMAADAILGRSSGTSAGWVGP